MAHFVLVGGTWLGPWVWHTVGGRLAAAGHRISTPTLTGLAERRHEVTPSTGLEDHVADVVAALEWADEPVVLVGHSYAGIVVTAAADRQPDRVAQLVLIDAAVPRAGRSLFDDVPPPFRAAVEAGVAAYDGLRWPMPPPEVLDQFLPTPDMSEADRTWLRSHAVAHPVRTFRDPVALTGAAERIPTTFVACVLPGSEASSSALGVPPDWLVRTVRTGHWPMVTAPDALAAILAEVAARAAQPMAMTR
jgi:pimeloyl-ACP methyl ester carboxylesterase